MAKLQYRSISKRTVEALSVEKDTVFWDRELTGFGVRVYPSGSRYYVVQSRGPEGQKRVTVGRHGVISADQARRRAAQIINRIKAGRRNPFPSRCRRSWRAARRWPNSRPGIWRNMSWFAARRPRRGRTARLLASTSLPELGKLPAAALGREHVTALHYKLRHTPATANMVIAALSQMIKRGEDWGLIPEGGNPCRFVVKYKARRHERFLTEEEFRRLGRVLDELEAGGGVPVHAAAALRLLMLTGCRCNEISVPALGGCASGGEGAAAPRCQGGPAGGAAVAAAVKVLAELAARPWQIPG